MYKLIDGEICNVEKIEVVEIQNIIDATLAKAQPYIDGIASCSKQMEYCDAQINLYRAEISNLTEALDKELCRAIAPEKASILGF